MLCGLEALLVVPICSTGTGIHVPFTCQKLGQVLLLLSFVSIANNLVDAQVAMCTIAESNRSGRPAQLLRQMARVAEVMTLAQL